MTKEDRINRVLKALKKAGYNDDLVADGEIGEEAREAISRFLLNTNSTPEAVNTVINAMKEAGLNDNLVADGEVGDESTKALQSLMALANG